MLALGIVSVATLLVHLMALFVPIVRGRDTRRQFLWIAKLKVMRPFDGSFCLPNGRLLCSFFASIGCARR